MSEWEIIAIKQELSARRVGKFGPMPGSREAWLTQMDDVARAANFPNVYRQSRVTA